MTKPHKRKPVPQPNPDTPRVVEAFGDPEWRLRDLKHFDQPSCFNGIVSVRRYRVTVERVDEPLEVIHERLRKLWRESDNHHHRWPLLKRAKEYGLELEAAEFGRDRRRSK